MSVEYTIDFKNDYKNTILSFFDKNEIDTTVFDTNDISKLSYEFHKYQKELLESNATISEDTSVDPKYSSDMMFKWLDYLEESIGSSIDEIIELTQQNNIKVDTFPLDIQLQLDIETQSFEIYETVNGFNINMEL